MREVPLRPRRAREIVHEEFGDIHRVGEILPGRLLEQYTGLSVARGKVDAMLLLVGHDLSLPDALDWFSESLPKSDIHAEDAWHYEIHHAGTLVATLRATEAGPVAFLGDKIFANWSLPNDR